MEFAILALFGFILVLGTFFIALRGLLRDALTLLVIALSYCSGYLQTILPVRYILAGTAFVILSGLVSQKFALSHKQRRAGLLVMTVSLCAYTVTYASVDQSLTDPLFRYTVLFPLMVTCGFLLAKAGNTHRFAQCYVLVSCCMDALAGIERLSGKFLVAGSYANSERLFRDGSIRSIVFAEHPLVLSVLLLAAIPLLSKVIASWFWRIPAATSLLLGIISTNSRGALIMLACWAAFVFARKLGLVGAGASRFARTSALAAILFLFLGSLFANDSDQLSSSNAIDASAEYRSALYLYAAKSLATMPGGWGIGGLPEGTYFVASFFGPLDLSRTVDSELALAVFDFGWIGLISFSGMVVALLSAGRIHTGMGQSALIITASGFYLALHSWSGLGSVWMLVAGLALGASAASNGKAVSLSAVRAAHPSPPSVKGNHAAHNVRWGSARAVNRVGK